jgi:hypothetical protein
MSETETERMKVYITFGSKHTEDHAEKWPFVHHDGYVTFDVPDWETAREAAFVMFDRFWAFDYRDVPKAQYVPRGELAVVYVERQEDGGMSLKVTPHED